MGKGLHQSKTETDFPSGPSSDTELRMHILRDRRSSNVESVNQMKMSECVYEI